ncbi:MAG: hypothetical protein M3M98_02285, partial [Nitrospirota bacterium]|nr:hypothetical protein [Nitrospirota bacterium]
AYLGEGPTVLTGLFAGQHRRYALFLQLWLSYNWTLLAILVVIGLTLIATTVPEVQRYIDAQTGRAPTPQVALLLGAKRARFVRMFIGFLVGGSLLSIGTGVEVWPFSPYPMYQTIQGPTASQSRVAIVTEKGEVDLLFGRWLAPLDPIRLDKALDRLRQRDDRGTALRAVATFALQRYDSLRSGGEAAASAAIGVRIYQAKWVLEPWARNRNRPDTITMMLEWKKPDER